MGRMSADIRIRRTGLPAGYTRLEYVVCSGAQWFDLGFKGTASLDFDVTAMATDTSTLANYGIFGGRTSAGGARYDASIGYSSSDNVALGTVFWGLRSTGYTLRKGYALGKVRLVKSGNVLTVYNEGVQEGTLTGSSSSFTAGRNITVGGVDNNGTIVNPFKGRLYRLVFGSRSDLVPAKRDSDSAIGFYDLVRGTFYQSTTGTPFTAGPDGLDVPITPECRRVWKLGGDDYITLRWDSPDEYRAVVGDWVDDELFGKFYVTEAQDPSIDPATGAYRHEVRFDRDYIGWKNVIHMLTYGAPPVRRETGWSLTDTLYNHLDAIRGNLSALGYSVSYSVGSGVENPDRAVSVLFSGTSVYDALNAIAEAYRCEWWVTHNSTYTACVINMGRCESGSEYAITLGENAESVTASKSGSEYANRIFAFGSTRNIPDTYRKTLAFNVTDTETQDGVTVFRDSARKITRDMLKTGDGDRDARTLNLLTPHYIDTLDDPPRRVRAVFSSIVTLARDTRFSVKGSLRHTATFLRNDAETEIEKGWAWEIKAGETVLDSGTGTFGAHETANGRAVKTVSSEIDTAVLLPAGSATFSVSIWTEWEQFDLSEAVAESGSLTITPVGYKVDCPLVYGGNTYTVEFNPLCGTTSQEFNWFTFPDGVPSGFGVGSAYTLSFSDGDTDGLLRTRVPSSFYTDDLGDTTMLRMVGERRLMLPTTTPGYVERGDTSIHKVVEKVVVFEEEYPRMALQITEIETGSYTDNTDYADGSRTYGTLPKYTIKVKSVNPGGSLSDFTFSKEYLTTEPLTAVFMSRDEAHTHGSVSESRHLLSGMSFGVSFNQANQTYTIAFNEDYGAKLPNGVLMPEVGDCLFLTGWDTKAMEGLGLIAAAEARLLADANAYLDAVSEPSLTLSCAMMSDRMLSDGLLSGGRAVIVTRGALKVSTRVIGYEYKLDIPEDTPVYECGETAAYSRLRELEKVLRASVQSTSSSGNPVSGTSVTVSGEGGSAQLNGALTWIPGNVVELEPGVFNGTEDKTLTIPTEIGHLAGNANLPRIGSTIETLDDGSKVVDLIDSAGTRLLTAGMTDWFIEEAYEEGGETLLRLKLNPRYEGMYAEGWVSGGGVSSQGGGGGGATSMPELSDVDDNLYDGITVGQALVWDGAEWTAGTVIPDLSDYLRLDGGTMTGALTVPASSSSANDRTKGLNLSDKAHVGVNGNNLGIYSAGTIVMRPMGSTTNGLSLNASDITFNGESLLTQADTDNRYYTQTQSDGRYLYKSLYSLDDNATGYGILVKTTMPEITSRQAIIHIKGNAYPGTIDSRVTFYNYTSQSSAMHGPTAIHNGYDLGDVHAFCYNGYVYIWFARPAKFSTILVYCSRGNGVSGENVVDTITYAPIPSGVTRHSTITPAVSAKVSDLSSYATISLLNSSLANYLPLSAGSDKALTGTLYSQDIYSYNVRPRTNSTSQNTGYNLGTSSYNWRNLYVKRIYLSSAVYIEYDSTNQGVRVVGAGIITDNFITGGGVSTT